MPRATHQPEELATRQETECRRLLEIVEGFGAVQTTQQFRSDEAAYRGQEPTDGLYILTDGILKISETSSSGKHTITRMLARWDVFGRLYPTGVVDGQSAIHGCTGSQAEAHAEALAEAVIDCEIIKIPRVFVQRSVRNAPETALSLAALLELRLAEQEELMRCVSARRTGARLARLLPILARKFGENGAGGAIAICIRLTHHELADMIAATRESVSKAMVELQDRGTIGYDRGRIILLDPDELGDLGDW